MMRKYLFRLLSKVFSAWRRCIFFVIHGVWLDKCGKNIEVDFVGHVRLGRRVVIESGAYICCEKGGGLSIGDDVYIGRGVYIKCYSGDVCIGNNVSLNAFVFLNGAGGLCIENDVRIGSHSSIIASNHVFSDGNALIRSQGTTKMGIKVSQDCWLGTGVRILDGVMIGEGAVIAAGAVVNKSTSSYSVMAGVPAKVVKRRN